MPETRRYERKNERDWAYHIYFFLFLFSLLKGSKLHVAAEIPVVSFVKVTKIANSAHYGNLSLPSPSLILPLISSLSLSYFYSDIENALQLDTATGTFLLVASTTTLQTEWIEAVSSLSSLSHPLYSSLSLPLSLSRALSRSLSLSLAPSLPFPISSHLQPGCTLIEIHYHSYVCLVI